MKAFLVYPKKAQQQARFFQNQYPQVEVDDRPTLVIAKDIVDASKDFPSSTKVTECNVKDIVIKKENKP